MRKKFLSLISILLTMSIISITFAFQASAEESESVVIENKDEKCELKDNVLTWTISGVDGDFTMTFKDGVCSVDGNIIKKIYSPFHSNDFEDSDNSNDSDDSNGNIYDLVRNYMEKNPINELVFSDNVTEIYFLFELMKVYSNITKVTLGKNVNIIGGDAFYRTSIKELIIPENVKEVNAAFIACFELKDITILSKDVSLEKSGIGFDYKNFMGNVITENGLAEPFEDVTIRGYLDSTSEIYARKYNFKFIGLDGTRGDSNEDSKLNIVDAAFIAKRVAQRKTDLLPSCADYNMDGNCDILDAAAIARDVARRKI